MSLLYFTLDKDHFRFTLDCVEFWYILISWKFQSFITTHVTNYTIHYIVRLILLYWRNSITKTTSRMTCDLYSLRNSTWLIVKVINYYAWNWLNIFIPLKHTHFHTYIGLLIQHNFSSMLLILSVNKKGNSSGVDLVFLFFVIANTYYGKSYNMERDCSEYILTTRNIGFTIK